MTAVLLDTHAWVWTLTGDARLSKAAVDSIAAADTVYVSPITFFEITQKVRLGKWPEMEKASVDLVELLAHQGGAIAALEAKICVRAGLMEWSHRDPFDRFLAATALHYNLPLVSADVMFDGTVNRIW